MLFAAAAGADLHLASGFQLKSYHLGAAGIAFAGALQVRLAVRAAETGHLACGHAEIGLDEAKE